MRLNIWKGRKNDLRDDLFPVTVRLELVMELATKVGV